MRLFLTLIALLIAMPPSYAAPSYSAETRAIIILAYHHINDEHANALTGEQFDRHIAALRANNTPILPASTLDSASAAASQRGVILTFDLMNAPIFERLIKKDIPFTVFINPVELTPSARKWIEKNKTKSAIHFGLTTAFNDIHDKEKTLRDIHAATTAFRALIGEQPRYFSYHQGLYTPQTLNLLKKSGIKLGFAQHSSVLHENSERLALPRFTMTEKHGGDDRFNMVTNAQPLKSYDITPAKTAIVRTPTPAIGMTLAHDMDTKSAIDCFTSGQEKPSLKMLGDSRIEIRLANALAPYERLRVNCISKAGEDERSGETIWRWHGWLLQYAPPSASHTES